MDASAFSTHLSDRTPRPAKFTAGTQATRFFFLLLFAAGVGLVIGLANRDLKDLSSLKSGGTTTTGHITDKHETYGKSTTYYLNYEFGSGSTSIDDETSVSWNQYSDTNIGDPLTVTYLPSQPNIHRIGTVTDNRIQDEKTHWGWICLFSFLVWGGIFLAVEVNYRRHLALLRDGISAPGKVIGNRIVGGKTNTYYVRYQFAMRRLIEIREVVVPVSVYNSLPEGKAITVLYDARNPKRSIPYEALTDVKLG